MSTHYPTSLGLWISNLLGHSTFVIRHSGYILLTLGLFSLLLLSACGTPQQRYHTLTIFFDGVPDPDAPIKGQVQSNGKTTAVSLRIVSQHKPYLDNQCDSCHAGANGDVQDFALAYNACVKCHKTVATAKPLMHGPVARAQCKWCHAPHQSTEPYLLKDAPIKVCTQCHDKQLLGNNPPEHSDGTTSCLNCHYGHGGADHYFIKSPSTQPTTQPATQPTTMPAATLPGKDRGS